MFKALFLVFIIIPIIEIALLIQMSEVIGPWSTLALVVVTALIGAKFVKQQGTQALRNVQSQMARGQMPAQELFAGLCVIIAGVLLVTPGIMTDVIGFLLLTPAIRNKMAAGLIKQAHLHTASSSFSSGGFNQAPFTQGKSQGQTYENEPQHEQQKTLEAEFKRKE